MLIAIISTTISVVVAVAITIASVVFNIHIDIIRIILISTIVTISAHLELIIF